MEQYDLSKLKPGEKLIVETESGSFYHLEAETKPERLSEYANLFTGLIATRKSNHEIEGRPQLIEDEHAKVIIRSGRTDDEMRVGNFMEIMWDVDHPVSKHDWDIQLGPKFHPLTTSHIVDI